jgi:hypothetical protein
MARRKNILLKNFNIRTIKQSLTGFLYSIPFLRNYFSINKYCVNVNEVAKNICKYSLNYDLKLNDTEKDFFRIPSELSTNKNIYLAHDLSINGRSGCAYTADMQAVLDFIPTGSKLGKNLISVRHLKQIPSDDETIYVNLLGIRKGHKQIYHFYEDLVSMAGLIFNNLDKVAAATPLRKITLLVRNDLSTLQKLFYSLIHKQKDGFEITFKTVTDKEKIHCKNLLIPSILSNISRRFIDRETIDFANSIMSSELYGMDKYQNIYLSRKDAKLRNLNNEKELLKKFSEYETIIAGNLSVAEQMRAFFNANNIIAIHGAGLVNLIYAKEGTKLTEMFPSDHNDGAYIIISRIKNIPYKLVVGSQGNYYQDFSVDINKL